MIGIVLSGEVSISPYIRPYLDALNETRTPYKIICWSSRDGSPLFSNPEGCIEFHCDSRPKNKFAKLATYWSFGRFVTKAIRKYSFEKVLFLTTPSVFFVSMGLLKKYRGRFIYDFRDATYENISVFRKRVLKISSLSAFTSVSSPGFRSLFPNPSNLVLCHNAYSYSLRQGHGDKPALKRPFVIGYFGIVRDLESIFGCFDNDPNYEVRVYGKMDETMRAAFDARIVEKQISNIHFFGPYSKDQLPSLMKEIDAVVYYYSNTFNFSIALGNRFYDCLAYSKPMVVNASLFCGRYVLENGVGVAFDKSNVAESSQAVARFLESLDLPAFEERCVSVLKNVETENSIWNGKIRAFLR